MSDSTRLLAIAGIALLVGTAAVPAASAQSAPSETTFVVDLHENGDAVVTLQLAFDLGNESERRALERLRDNESELAAAYRDNLGSVAARTAESTGREMQVTDPSVEITTEGETGSVELSATWTNLAALEGDRLVVSEPFAEAFTAPGTFEIRAPAGYTIVSSSVETDATGESVATWSEGSSLDGLEVEMAPASGSAATSLGVPGFGPTVAVLGAGLAGLLAVMAKRT